MIEIYDDFFSEEIQEEIFYKLMKPHWCIDGNTLNKSEIFWHYNGLENDQYFNEYLYEKICAKLGRSFSSIGRIYANGQTAGQSGTPHTDDGNFTFLYYPCLEWDPTWQGHLVFLNDDGEEGRMIIYRSNRALLFDSNICHYACAPSRFFNGLRISLAYKLWN